LLQAANNKLLQSTHLLALQANCENTRILSIALLLLAFACFALFADQRRQNA
jgi:hypothetical protein